MSGAREAAVLAAVLERAGYTPWAQCEGVRGGPMCLAFDFGSAIGPALARLFAVAQGEVERTVLVGALATMRGEGRVAT